MYCETKYGVKGFGESGGVNPLTPLGWSDNGMAPPLLGPFRAFSLNPPNGEGHGNLLTNENRVMSTTLAAGAGGVEYGAA